MTNDTNFQPGGPAMQQPIQPQPQIYTDPDEINLLEYVYELVKNKWLIIGVTILGLVLGYVAARIKGPTYTATAVIAPKENDSRKMPSVSGFGALGGLVASQLNIGGNASLDKIDIVLDSRKFGAELLEKYNLIPSVYELVAPKYYKENYNEDEKKWVADSLKPEPMKIAGVVNGEFLEREVTKSNTMEISVNSKDSSFSHTLLENGLEYLDLYIRESTQEDANENIKYLEKQLTVVSDPLLRAKIQELVAQEYEKAMVVSKEAFQIIDPPFPSVSHKEKKLYPLVFAFGLFFLTVLFVVFKHAFVSGEKTEEDKKLIEGIRRELRLGRR
ncbi:MAG: hypothetical protein GF401_18545 [Chitinivibrionales bacterium]|nr:hypothetical protein [Chitinivibrionales bacterium]